MKNQTPPAPTETDNRLGSTGSVIANEIADALMLSMVSDHSAVMCERLQLMKGTDNGERNMGGLCRTAVVGRIDMILAHHGFCLAQRQSSGTRRERSPQPINLMKNQLTQFAARSRVLLQRLVRLVRPLVWQPIATVPKDGRAVVLCWAINADGRLIDWNEEPESMGVFLQVASWQADHWNVYINTPTDARLHFEPTHWMPVPNPPSA